jgi:hypothetical protein
MPIEQLKKYTCDLCGKSETKSGIPHGWITVAIEDRYEERMFHDKVVCNGCLQRIDRARAGRGN